MNRYHIFVLLLIVVNFFPAFAREYWQVQGQCHLEVTESDMFGQERQLPYTLDIDFIASFDVERNRFIGKRLNIRQDISATHQLDKLSSDQLKSSFKFFSQGGILYYYFTLRRRALSGILLYAGGYRSYQLNFPEIKSPKLSLDQVNTFQTHQPPHIHNGLSYHITLACLQSDAI